MSLSGDATKILGAVKNAGLSLRKDGSDYPAWLNKFKSVIISMGLKKAFNMKVEPRGGDADGDVKLVDGFKTINVLDTAESRSSILKLSNEEFKKRLGDVTPSLKKLKINAMTAVTAAVPNHSQHLIADKPDCVVAISNLQENFSPSDTITCQQLRDRMNVTYERSKWVFSRFSCE